MANYQTMQIWVKKNHRMHGYFKETCQHAKNMHNTTNFYHGESPVKLPPQNKERK